MTPYATLGVTSALDVAFLPRGNLLKAFISAAGLLIWRRSISAVDHGGRMTRFNRARHAFASQRRTSHSASQTVANLDPPPRERRSEEGDLLRRITWLAVLSLADCCLKGKGSPYSIAEHRVPELIPVLGSQPAGDVSHKPGGRLPLLFARPAVTPATLKRAATNFAAW